MTASRYDIEKKVLSDGRARGHCLSRFVALLQEVRGYAVNDFSERRLRAKAGIGLQIVLFKIKIMFNQGRPEKCVIPDTIAAYPRVEQRQGEEKKQEEQALGLARARPGRRI